MIRIFSFILISSSKIKIAGYYVQIDKQKDKLYDELKGGGKEAIKLNNIISVLTNILKVSNLISLFRYHKRIF